MKKLLMMACVASLATGAFAQKAYTVNFTSAAPTIDGVAGATEWNTAPVGGGDFVAHDTGVVSTEQTTFKVLFDEVYLYVLMVASDNNVEFDPNFTGNNATFTFQKDDLELMLDPISSRNDEANPPHQYQMVFYPQTDGSGQPTNAPQGFIWAAGGSTNFPGAGSWPSGVNATVRVVVTPGTPATLTMEARIPWASFDLAAVNTAPVSLPPQNNDVWSAQPARAHNAASANNTGASKWNPSGAGFRTKPWGLWTFTGRPAPSAAQDWQHLQ